MEIDYAGFFSLFEKYKIEVFLILTSLIVTLISFTIYSKSDSQDNIDIVENKNEIPNVKSSSITIDVSGAVNSPGVYELQNGSRINDAIKKAKGLSQDADTSYFFRNFNLSAYLFDQEKIYIPYVWEINSGIFTEEQRILNYLSPFTIEGSETNSYIINSEKININTALSKELEDLPGIGQKTAQKIIENRPYKTIEELLSKKVLNEGVFENIKDQISVQ